MEIKRDRYLQELICRMHNGMIKTITGIRRSGKSYLVFQIFRDYLIRNGVEESHIIAIELDRRENRKYRDPDAEKVQQEKASLVNVNDFFKKIIIVKDVINIQWDEKGITTMSIYDFLLNENSLEM